MNKAIGIILCFIFALCSCKSYRPASGNLDYCPLKVFNKDTLAYFNYNFREHKDFYIGKNFSVLQKIEKRKRMIIINN